MRTQRWPALVAMALLAACADTPVAPEMDLSPSFAAGGGPKVAICHFPGHAGLGDWVISAQGFGCVETPGGNIILVTQKACKKGHDALEALGFFCTTDNIPNIDPELIKGHPYLGV